jgi:hypothetical protein
MGAVHGHGPAAKEISSNDDAALHNLDTLLGDMHVYFDTHSKDSVNPIASMVDLKTQMRFFDSCFERSAKIAGKLMPPLGTVLATLRTHTQKNTADLLFVYLREKDEWKSRLRKEKRGKEGSSATSTRLSCELHAMELLNTAQAKRLSELQLQLAKAMLKSGDEADLNKAMAIVKNIVKSGGGSEDAGKRADDLELKAHLDSARTILEEVDRAKIEVRRAREKVEHAKLEAHKLEEAARRTRLQQERAARQQPKAQTDATAVKPYHVEVSKPLENAPTTRERPSTSQRSPDVVDTQFVEKVVEHVVVVNVQESTVSPSASNAEEISRHSISYDEPRGEDELQKLQAELRTLRQSSELKLRKLREMQERLKQEAASRQQDLLRIRQLESESRELRDRFYKGGVVVAPTPAAMGGAEAKSNMPAADIANEGIDLWQSQSTAAAPQSNMHKPPQYDSESLETLRERSLEVNNLQNQLADKCATIDMLRAKLREQRNILGDRLTPCAADATSGPSTNDSVGRQLFPGTAADTVETIIPKTVTTTTITQARMPAPKAVAVVTTTPTPTPTLTSSPRTAPPLGAPEIVRLSDLAEPAQSSASDQTAKNPAQGMMDEKSTDTTAVSDADGRKNTQSASSATPAAVVKDAPRSSKTEKKTRHRKNRRQSVNAVGTHVALELLLNFRDSSEVFDTFTDDDIADLVGFMDIVPFTDSDPIIAQGEEASWAGFILDGGMSVKVNGNKVATMKNGSILGELAVLEGGKRTATCEGEGNGVIGAISFEVLDTMHQDAPELAVKLFTAFGAAGVGKLRARLAQNTGGGGGGEKSEKTSKKRRRKKISTKGRAKKKSDASFTASSAAEVFYRSMVAKAERETGAAEARNKEAEERVKKVLQKQKTERMLRMRAERKMEEMKEEIMRLQAEATGQKFDDPDSLLEGQDETTAKEKLKKAAHLVGKLTLGLKM